MKIIIDNIIFALQKSGGISVVWYELSKRLISEYDDVHFIIYSKAKENIFGVDLLNKFDGNIIKRSLPNLDRYFDVLNSNVKIPFIFHSSYYRVSSNRNAINITTVHDFIYEKFRTGLKSKIHCIQKRNAILKSHYIICVSENTKRDLLELFPGIDESKIYVVYNGVSDQYSVIEYPKLSIIPYSIKNYLLYVGVRDDYKRFDFAIKLAQAINVSLVLVGGGDLSPSESDELRYNLGDNYFYHLNGISNVQLCHLYNGALALIYPSSYEGFGIPIIEAQKSGCPVIAYNSGAMKEITGHSPLLFDSYDVEEVKSLVDRYIYDDDERNKIISLGLKNSAKFSWDNTFKHTLEIYEDIIKKHV